MATLTEQITPGSALDRRNQLFQQYLGRPLSYEDVAGLGGQGVYNSQNPTGQAISSEIFNSPEYLQKQQTRATTQLAPSYANLDLNRQQAQNQSQQAIGQLDLNDTSAEDQYNTLLQQLQQQQAATPQNILNSFQQLGTRSSGLAGTQLAQGMQNDQTAINSAQKQRALTLGNLALQKANILQNQQAQNTGFTNQQDQLDLSKQDLINSLINNDQNSFSDQNTAAFNRAIQGAQLGSSIPSGQSIDLGQFGRINGTQTNSQALQDLFSNPLILDSLPDDLLKQLLEAYGYTVTQ